MKKFIVAVSALILCIILFSFAYFELGLYIDFRKNAPSESFVRTRGEEIEILQDGEWQSFTVKGVNLGTGEPGQWSTEFAVSEETYLRWFMQMQEMGANTLRVYTIQSDAFYNAFYQHNTAREKSGKAPLYLLHGVWVGDYVINSHMDAYNDAFKKELIKDCRTMIDVIHGRKNISVLGKPSQGTGTYRRDVSKWVIGYILGVEWESELVIYTDMLGESTPSYKGKYMYASEDATAFESLLCEIGDKTVSYEASKYKTQRLVAFSNWCTTDPFKYSVDIAYYFNKMAYVNTEHILSTDALITGTFASYHVYPYFPDYLGTGDMLYQGADYDNAETRDNSYLYLKYKLELADAPFIGDYLTSEDYTDDMGRTNTYRAYLTALERFHTVPVVISEFGVSSGRGIAQVDRNTGRNQGNMSEAAQGQALVECWEDIMAAGCNGGCVFSWQDEWFKRTWNTMHAIDLDRTAFWSDTQTNEQYFGLLSFDPGRERSVCYVNGDASEWSEKDIVARQGESTLSVKYDEKFIYFMVQKKGLDLENDTLYIPIDLTPKTGSYYCRGEGQRFDRPCDFLLTVRGKENSRLQVQQRYEVLRSTYGDTVYHENAYSDRSIPDRDTPEFVNIDLILQKTVRHIDSSEPQYEAEVFETGLLRYGNSDPTSEDFDSLSDFYAEGDCLELRLPWQLLNFADPSTMRIHDDYYSGGYGIEFMSISEMFVGLSAHGGEERIHLDPVPLIGWNNKVTYHERLKASYYILQDYWTEH